MQCGNDKRIVLRERLDCIIGLLPSKCRTVADVGADHGRLGVAILQRNAAEHILASDISEPSLEKAKRLARLCGVEGRIEFFVADGLCYEANEPPDAIIIAGMGGSIIADIIKKAGDRAKRARRIIAQPQRGCEELRVFLRENGYSITEEKLVFDAGRYYQIICAGFTGETDPLPEGFTPDMLEYGYRMLCDPLLLPMLEKYKSGLLRRLERAKRANVSPCELVRLIDMLGRLTACAVAAQKQI